MLLSCLEQGVDIRSKINYELRVQELERLLGVAKEALTYTSEERKAAFQEKITRLEEEIEKKKGKMT